jgi:hypothetical protein
MYNLALEANPRLEETSARMHNLANGPVPEKQLNAREELNLMRTIQLPTITATNASADFRRLARGQRENRKSKFFQRFRDF